MERVHDLNRVVGPMRGTLGVGPIRGWLGIVMSVGGLAGTSHQGGQLVGGVKNGVGVVVRLLPEVDLEVEMPVVDLGI